MVINDSETPIESDKEKKEKKMSFEKYYTMTEGINENKNALFLEIQKILKDSGYDFYLTGKQIYVKMNRTEEEKEKLMSIFDPSEYSVTFSPTRSTFGSLDIESSSFGNVSVSVIMKELSKEGRSATTVNSSITEFVPIVMFLTGIKPNPNYEKVHEAVTKKIMKGGLPCFLTKEDESAAQTFILEIKENPKKLEEKMLASYQVYNFIQETFGNDVDNIYWTYRTKPQGLPKNFRSDIAVVKTDGSIVGVSLKAGTSIKEAFPMLNTFVKNVFGFFGRDNEYIELEQSLWDNIYSKIDVPKKDGKVPDFPRDYKSKKNIDNTRIKLHNYETKYQKEYDDYYVQARTIIKTSIIDMMNTNPKKLKEFLLFAESGQTSDVQLLTVKVSTKEWHLVDSDSHVNIILGGKGFAATDLPGQQNFIVSFVSNKIKYTMNFSVRSNRPGINHKLGQFENLAFKYNGMKESKVK